MSNMAARTADSSHQSELIQENVPLQSTELSRGTTRRAFLLLIGIFTLSVASLLFVYYCFPELQKDEVQFIKLPKDIDDAKNLGRILSRYKDRYFFTVLSAFFMTYVFLQSFAIPGSIFLSILSGFLFPFPLALLLVCSCSALGASLCYLLSCHVGRRVVLKYFPQRAADWSHHVNKHRSNLLNYIIFLRITPFLPNWFINITSPVIGVPAVPFILGTFIVNWGFTCSCAPMEEPPLVANVFSPFGTNLKQTSVAPPSFVMIQAGQTLHLLTSSKDAISWTSVLLLALLAVLSLVPIAFKKKLREKLE